MGWIGAAAREGQLVRVTLPRPTREEARRECSVADSFEHPARILLDLAEDLRRYFQGRPVDFTGYRVDLRGHPPFRRRVLLAARLIPYGQVRSYGWLAGMAGKPKASRAVGQAMAHNPLPLVIPCHRVVRSDRALGGFGGGRSMKRDLLELEGIQLGGDVVVCSKTHRRAEGAETPSTSSSGTQLRLGRKL